MMSLGNISSESDRSSGKEREGLQRLDQGWGPGWCRSLGGPASSGGGPGSGQSGGPHASMARVPLPTQFCGLSSLTGWTHGHLLTGLLPDVFGLLLLLLLAMLGLWCYMWVFPSCGEQGLTLVAVCWLLIAVCLIFF